MAGRPVRRTKQKIADAVDKLVKLGLDPIEAMATLARDQRTPIDQRVTLLRDLAQYWAPKKRSVEVAATDSIHKIEVSWVGDGKKG